MQLLQRALRIVSKPDGQPIQQFRITGFAPHVAEIVGGIHQSSTEVVMPNAVDDAAPGEHVAIVDNPAG